MANPERKTQAKDIKPRYDKSDKKERTYPDLGERFINPKKEDNKIDIKNRYEKKEKKEVKESANRYKGIKKVEKKVDIPENINKK